MAGSYRDDEDGRPWRVCLYIDERATSEQHTALAEIFSGRAGGTTLRNYASVIGEVYAVRRAHIELDHRRHHWSMRAEQLRGGAAARRPSNRRWRFRAPFRGMIGPARSYGPR